MKITSEQLSCKRLQIALALWARAIWLAYEKFTRDDLSQIALEIMCIIILIPYLQKFQHAHRPTTCQSQIVQRVAIESKKFNFN